MSREKKKPAPKKGAGKKSKNSIKKFTKATKVKSRTTSRNEFPKLFPFWARLKIGKNRPTLIIDEGQAYDKKAKKEVDGYVHREVIHLSEEKKNDKKYIKNLEQISPNPDKADKKDMYLKRPDSLPKKLFKPHNQDWEMPETLKQRYDKNNRKDKK